MKKILFVATVVKTHINVFHLKYLKWFKSQGYEVHVCAKNDYKNKNNCYIPFCDKYFDVPFSRSPLDFKNFKAYIRLKKIIDKNNYDIIHCHTPVGSVLTRLAARKSEAEIIYTAHGFHFFDGAPIKNWLLYYPIEKLLSFYTDVLITINNEDYRTAKEKNFKAKKLKYVPGVGINTNKFQDKNIDKQSKYKELSIPNESFILLSVGELNENKNHETIIRSLNVIMDDKIHYIICGKGELREKLNKLIYNLKLEKQVHLLGYRDDISEIMAISDLFIFPSQREGLGLAALEAMASGLPIITSNIHGINDYSIEGVTGFKCNPKDIDCFVKSIIEIKNDNEMRKEMGNFNKKYVKRFDEDLIMKQMIDIYKDVLYEK